MAQVKANQPKIILGIETSCDETAAAVCQKTEQGVKILSNIVASSANLQAKYGGVIPEQAAREQLKFIIPVINESLRVSGFSKQDIDAIAVTQGPGLIGSLLVGVETAKVLATVWNKPLVPINHLLGHFYANWIAPNSPTFPCIGLLVSGGHTDLVLFKSHGKYEYLGGTRDDAAGECFDKSARLLNLPYPGGPEIAKLAQNGNPQAFKLPRPMINLNNFDFSFSGLKTAVGNLVTELSSQQTTLKTKADIAASLEAAIVDVLVNKTLKAVKKYQVKQVILAGGVAANQKLNEKFTTAVREKLTHVTLFIPPPKLCTDNAVYIATAAFYNYHPANSLTLQANPNLSLQLP